MPMNGPETHDAGDAMGRLCRLSETDARALETAMGWLNATDTEQGTLRLAAGGGDERSDRVASVVELLDHCGVEQLPDDLVSRTLVRVRQIKQQDRFDRQIEQLSGGGIGGGLWWGELAAMAAVVLVGVSLLLPALNRVRGDARRAACAGNLGAAGAAIGRYAAGFGNQLPRGQVTPGSVWWNVGQHHRKHESGAMQSNSAHLYLLVRMGYVSADTLRCPDNASSVRGLDASLQDWPHAKAVSYSYQNQYTTKPLRLDMLPKMAILADKNPMFVDRSDGRAGLRYRSDMDPQTPSAMHGGRGQNILTSAGSVVWSEQPTGPNGDNIWLIRGVREYRGTEAPADADDSFLVP